MNILLQQYSPSTHGTILVVDDNPSNLGFLFEHLEQCGFRVLVALSGDEALNQLERAHPDLVLLDVMMPGIDGFDTCRQIKQRENLRTIPIIFMSALTDPREKVRAFEAGAIDYVTKPVNKDEVVARINTQVSLQLLQREIEERNRELERKSQELGERNEDLSAFGHMVAHDLRSGLARILGFTELMLSEPEYSWSDEQREDVQTIHQAAVDMREIVRALMELGGVSRELTVDRVEVDMAAVVHRVQDLLCESIEQSEARVLEPETWPAALGYPPWLERVWFNYMHNAIKYGGKPPRLELGAGSAGSFVRFWIRDNGLGVPESARASVFEPFSRFHNESVDGHGLGLAIVQRIIRKLGGEVGNSPLPDGGSEFYFTLPAAS